MESELKLDLPTLVPAKIDQGKNVVTMSKVVMTGEQPLIDGLEMTTAQTATAYATAITARQTSVQATAALNATSVAQKKAYGLLADHVSVLAEGDASFILSTGYGVRNTPAPYPPNRRVSRKRGTAILL